jgi:hypothetical protein
VPRTSAGRVHIRSDTLLSFKGSADEVFQDYAESYALRCRLRHEDHKHIFLGSIQNMVSLARPIHLTDKCFLWAYASLGKDGESLCVPKTLSEFAHEP